MMQRHTKIYAYTVGYQPNAPHNNTETIEMFFSPFTPLHIRPDSPHSVNKHQQDSDNAGHSMYFIMQVCESRNILH